MLEQTWELTSHGLRDLMLYENKTCCGIWNNAVSSLIFWYQYFHMLNIPTHV